MHKLKLFLLLLTLVVPIKTVCAQDILQEGSLAISPFLIDTEIIPGQPKSYTIEIYNTENVAKTLNYSIQDFVPSGPHGEVRFLPVGETNKPEYSLNDWIHVLNQPQFNIPANGKTAITFELIPPKDASVGSHYGGLLFSFASESDAEIQVSKKIGALIIARFGRGKPEGELSASVNQFHSTANINIHSTFSNTGNAHLTPKGKFYIYNIFGKLTGVTAINPDANIVLPQNSREFSSLFQKKFLLGRYKAEGIVYYSTDPKLETRKTLVFWVFPIKTVASYGASGILLLVMFYLFVRKYNNWLISKAK